MKLQQLRQFVALAETLNFHRAAEMLNMAQPPLSVSLRKLELELGADLFTREQRRVEITAAGIAALPEARLALFHATQLKLAVQENNVGERGSLRIGFVGSATYALLPKLLRAFRKRYPNVELVLEESWTTELLKRVEIGLIDLAIVRVPVLDEVTVDIDVLENDTFVAVVPQSGPFADRTSIDLRELRGEPFILYSKENVPNLRALVLLMCQEAGFHPTIAQETIQAQTMISLVQSGLGVALVAGVASRYSAADIKFLDIVSSHSANRLGLALAMPRDHKDPIAENFRRMALRIKSETMETVTGNDI